MKTLAFVTGAATALALTAVSAAAQVRAMQIGNDTGFTIVALYATQMGSDDWGQDRLNGDPIEDYEIQTVDFDDGSGYCMYKLKAVFDDGEELISEDINVCDLPAYNYY